MYSYDYAGKILRQADSQNEIIYFYDYNSSVVALSYFGQVYIYKKDIFGNIVEILDFEGNTVVKYVYSRKNTRSKLFN